MSRFLHRIIFVAQANTYNVEIVSDDDLDRRMESLSLRLLTTERHQQEQLANFQPATQEIQPSQTQHAS